MLDFIGLSCFYFLLLVKYIVLIDIVLSWLPIFGVEVQVPFFRAILAPIYVNVKRIIPLNFGVFDFTPLIVLVLIAILQWILLSSFPSIQFSL